MAPTTRLARTSPMERSRKACHGAATDVLPETEVRNLQMIARWICASAIVGMVAIAPGARAQGAEIPVPPPFSGHDAKNFADSIDAAQAGKYSRALALAARIADPIAAKTAVWFVYSEPFSFPAFEDVSAFVEDSPDWPRQNGLLAATDRALAAKQDHQIIMDWYHWHDPASRQGRLRLADALLANGETDRAAELVRESWRRDSYSRSELRATERRYRDLLRQEDHLARLDYLVWNYRRSAAKHMYRYVSKGYQALAEARLALRRKRGGVDGAIARVPEELRNDPGLRYERLRWRRRKGKHDSATEILLNPPDNLIEPKRWWPERAIQVRRLLREGQAPEAYLMAAEHGQIHASTFSEGEWLAGWIALRYLNDPGQALRHFTSIYDVVFMPISRARAAYWSGRAAESAGQTDAAVDWYKRAAEYCTAYYGQLAATALHYGALDAPPCAETHSNTSGRHPARTLENHELLAAARRLAFIGEEKLFQILMRRLGELAKGPGDFELISDLALSLDRPDASIGAAKRASRNGYHDADHLYPVPDIPFSQTDAELEHALVLAIIRQESQFYVEATSHAGARGLMQLMPRTAQSVARRLRLGYARENLTRNPNYNIRLGSAYLSGLIRAYDGAYVLAIAAYNAGPGNVRKWIRTFGDPRTDPDINIIDWIEHIPLTETRNYVQRVLEGLQIYRGALGEFTQRTDIETDLNRGVSPATVEARCKQQRDQHRRGPARTTGLQRHC